MRIFITAVSVLAVALTLSIGCRNPLDKNVLASVSGYVYDEQGKPMTGVVIESSPPTAITTTNDKGFYEIKSIQPGMYEFTAKKPGYKEDIKSIYIDDNPLSCGSGNISINFVVSKLSWVITTYAGNGGAGFSGDDGLAVFAQLSPKGLAIDSSNNLYAVDSEHNRIRKITPTGGITTIAGSDSEGFGGDGSSATSAVLNSPFGVAIDANGTMFITDYDNHRVRKVHASGVISTIAGTGSDGFSGDGAEATKAKLTNPAGIAVDASGNLYVADLGNNRIRKIDPIGNISTVAGKGEAGYEGDGGSATSAKLNMPVSVAVDKSGNFYVADYLNHRIRKVDSSGNINTVAGSGKAGFSGDGSSATLCQLYLPGGVDVDDSGNIYISDSGNNRVRKVDTSGIIMTIAGNGVKGFGGDGNFGTYCQLDAPAGIVVSDSGSVYIADYGNKRVRLLSK